MKKYQNKAKIVRLFDGVIRHDDPVFSHIFTFVKDTSECTTNEKAAIYKCIICFNHRGHLYSVLVSTKVGLGMGLILLL